MPYRQHLAAAADLVTTHEATRAGFVAQALERNRRATPFVQQARDLQVLAARADTANALLEMADIQGSLLTAAGVSDKANKYLDAGHRRAAILGLIENFLLPAGAHFVEELVYRFLLTRGDTLGGMMRNNTGTVGEQRLSGALLARLRNQGLPFRWLREDRRWSDAPDDDAAAAIGLRGLHWMVGDQPRTLCYNLGVPHVSKNIDLCLFRLLPGQLTAANREIANNYVALGELKAGIDPAGADEHWKTARSAFNRIHAGFARTGVAVETFFIAGAIATYMANEIWEMLVNRTLQNAANLTNDDQLTSIVRWLTAI